MRTIDLTVEVRADALFCGGDRYEDNRLSRTPEPF